MSKSVSEIMTPKIETIGLEDTAQTAAKKMKGNNIGSLIVVDRNGQAVGIVTERDLVRQVCCRDARQQGGHYSTYNVFTYSDYRSKFIS